jgi:putative PIN family toxin of toxin-antitoxin system
MKVVLDTNVLLVSVSPRSSSNWLWHSLLSGDFDICVTTDILDEYAEILGREMGQEVADAVLDLLMELSTVHIIHKYFHWQLVEIDPDDNKFIDCAVAASAQYIVSHDRHLKVIDKYPYFGIKLMSIFDFKEVLEK